MPKPPIQSSEEDQEEIIETTSQEEEVEEIREDAKQTKESLLGKFGVDPNATPVAGGERHVPGKKPFIKQQIEEKNEFKRQLDEANSKLSEIAKERDSLRSDLEQARTTSNNEEAQQLRQRLSELENERKQIAEERDKFKRGIEAIDIQHSPEFKETYVAPMQKALKEAISKISGDESAKAQLMTAIQLHKQVVECQDENKRNELINQRDEIVGEITDNMSRFSASTFSRAIEEHFALFERFHQAISNIPDTGKIITEEREARVKKEQENIRREWESSYDTFELEDPSKNLPKSVLDIFSSEKIDLSEEERIVRDGFTGIGEPSKISPILKKGVEYKKLAKANELLVKRVIELESTIASLTRSGRTDGSPGRPNTQQTTTEEAKQSLLQMFRPGRTA